MSKTGTILSVMKPIADILMNNYTPYFIPDFQRDFVWGEKEVTERECKIVCVNRYCMNLLYAPYWGKQR